MQIVRTIKNIVNSTLKDDCPGMAAEMAYNFMLSIFPFLISAAAIFGLLGTADIINQILDSLRNLAPYGTLDLIRNTLKEIIHPSSGGLLTLGLISGIYIGSNAISVLMKVLNKAYGVPETRSYIQMKVTSIVAILIFTLGVFLVTNLIILGNIILGFLHTHFHLPHYLLIIISLAKWPVTFLILNVIGFMIYYFMPNVTENVKCRVLSSIPGTIFFTVAWLIMSKFFGLYVENFGTYNKVYGTLGAFIVLLLWLYYTSLVILIGGEINSEIYKQIKTKNS